MNYQIQCFFVVGPDYIYCFLLLLALNYKYCLSWP